MLPWSSLQILNRLIMDYQRTRGQTNRMTRAAIEKKKRMDGAVGAQGWGLGLVSDLSLHLTSNLDPSQITGFSAYYKLFVFQQECLWKTFVCHVGKGKVG